MKIQIKFACIYCGQHLECDIQLRGRQILCPTCRHRIVIPPGPGGSFGLPALPREAWDTDVPLPGIEVPTRYRRPGSLPAVLAR